MKAETTPKKDAMHSANEVQAVEQVPAELQLVELEIATLTDVVARTKDDGLKQTAMRRLSARIDEKRQLAGRAA